MNTTPQDPNLGGPEPPTLLPYVTATGIAGGDSPYRHGLATILGLAILALGLLATLALAIAGDADAAELAAKLGVGAGAITQAGKYAQAAARILAVGRARLEPTPLASTVVTTAGDARPDPPLQNHEQSGQEGEDDLLAEDDGDPLAQGEDTVSGDDLNADGAAMDDVPGGLDMPAADDEANEVGR